MGKVKDARPLTRQERIAEQMQLFTNYVRIMCIQDRSTEQTTIDDYSLSNFTELCSSITRSSSLVHIEVQTKLDVRYLNELYSCLRDNRTVTVLTFSELAYKPEIPFNIYKFLQRNLSLPKIVNFVIDNFKAKNNNKDLRDIKVEDYDFLKYCLPSNKDFIYASLNKLNFKGTCDWDSLIQMQFAFSNVCKDIRLNGGLFAILPSDIQILTFGLLEDGGIPCIGKHLVASDI